MQIKRSIKERVAVWSILVGLIFGFAVIQRNNQTALTENPPMTDAEFQTIAQQIDELEGALQEWDIRGDGATPRLPWLHQIITDLM